MNILIVGGGSIGRRHLTNLKSLGYYNIWVLKRKADENFAREHEVVVITTFDDAIDLEIDLIVVASPTSLHNESLKFAVIQKCSVFMEKPLIHSTEGLEEAKELMHGFKQTFFIGFMLRYHPLVKAIKEILEKNSLGTVYSARFEFGSFLPYWHPWEDYKTSYASRNDLGGGVINTITHELDLIQYFFGTPTSIYCEASNFNKLDIPVEENCEAIFTYSDKVVTLHLDYLQKDYDRNIKILCDEGKIIWDWHTNEIKVQKHKGLSHTIRLDNFDVNQLYIDELKDCLSLIEEKKSEHTLDFNHAKSNTGLMLLMHESSENGQRKNLQI